MAQDLATQIVDFPTRIPDCDDHQPYLLDLFLCSNPDCTVASHPPLGKSDVDVKFVVKSTNEHSYLHSVYSYSTADWDGLRDHLKDVPWLDIFKHDATYAAKEITEWVDIGIQALCCCHCTSQPLFPSVPSECDSHNHCKRVLKDGRSNYAETTCRYVASLCLSDLVTCGGFATAFLTGGSLPYLLFSFAWLDIY